MLATQKFAYADAWTGMDTWQVLLNSAFTCHRQGRLDEAEALYRRVLDLIPEQHHALEFLGSMLVDREARDEAESLFLRLLAVDPKNLIALHSLGRLKQRDGHHREAVALLQRASEAKPDFAPIFNDLAVSLNRLMEREAALAALDRALLLDGSYSVAHDNRGLVLYDGQRFLESAQAHLAALTHLPLGASPEQRASVLLHLSRAAFEADELPSAELACRSVLDMNADHEEALDQLANVLFRVRRDTEALAALNQLARAKGLVKKTQPQSAEATILILGGVGAGHVPTRYLFDPSTFTTLGLMLVSPDQPDAPLGNVAAEALTQVDVVFNALGEAEKQGGQFGAVTALIAQLGKPVINLPECVVRTGRERAVDLFGEIPGLLVPQVRKLNRAELAALSTFAKPILIRPVGTHGGEGLTLINTASEVADYLQQMPHEHFILTDFYDFKGARDCYRKYRFIFVDRQPFPYHLAIGENWLVHYWRAEMARSDWKKQEEADFLLGWRDVFGTKASAAVETVARRMDLDYAGMDCSLLPSGEVLFFEANACMLVHMDDDESEFPYKHCAVPNIQAAMTHMIRKRVAGGSA